MNLSKNHQIPLSKIYICLCQKKHIYPYQKFAFTFIFFLHFILTGTFDDYFRERRKWLVDLEGKKQGEWIMDKEGYYNSDNGYQSYQKVRSVIKYVDNMEQGEFISYHRDGSVHEKGNYINGKREGAYIAFDFKGRIIRKGNYKNGKKNGEWLEKDTVYNYKNDLKIGIYKTYFNDGNIKEINTYLEEGKIKIQELFYKAGQIKGKIKYICLLYTSPSPRD